MTDANADRLIIEGLAASGKAWGRFDVTIDEDKKASVPLTVSQLPAPKQS